METIPTAEKFRIGCIHDGSFIPVNEVNRLMIEFAKLHVQAALKAAWANAHATNKPKFAGDCNPVVDDESILTAYPLDNIK